MGMSSIGLAFENPRVTAYCLGDTGRTANVRESETPPEGPSRFRWYQIDNRSADGRRVYPPLLIAVTWANTCDDWTHCDRRVARLLTTTSPPVLIVGPRGVDVRGVSEIKPEKKYPVYDVSKWGTPFQGSISVKVPPGDFRNQRACLQKLKGLPLTWVDFDPISQEMPPAIHAVVEDVRFDPLGKLQGTGIRGVPTGEWLATLTVSETWTSLVRRRPLDSLTLLGVALTLISTVVTLFFRGRTRRSGA